MDLKLLKMDTAGMRGLYERIRRIGTGQAGISPRLIAIVLIAATAAYASVDLFSKITNSAGFITRIEGAALPSPAGAAGGKVSEKPAGQAIERRPLEAYQVIAARNLFGSAEKEIPGTGGALASGGYETSSLQLDLIGTIAGEDGDGRAVIDDKKKARSYRVGDRVADATLVKIMRNAVVLRVGDREEVLNMKVRQSQPVPGQPGRQPQAQPASPATVPALAAVPGSIATIRDMLNQAGARPHFEAGKMDGFYIGRVGEGTLLKRAGLENGDIIEGINDQPLQKPDDVFKLQNLTGSGGKIALKIKRQGRSMTLFLD